MAGNFLGLFGKTNHGNYQSGSLKDKVLRVVKQRCP